MIRIVTKTSAVYSRQEIWFWDGSEADEVLKCSNNIFYQALQKPTDGTQVVEFHTMTYDLNRTADELFEGIQKNFKYQINRAEREGFVFSVLDLTDPAAIDLYTRTFNEWAASKNMALLDADRFAGFLAAGSMTIAQVSFEGAPVVWHAYVVGHAHARMLTSHSNLAFDDSIKQGRANKYLHWQAVLHFKAQGIATYDFGGVDEEATPGIARFKLAYGGDRVTHYNFVKTTGLYKPLSTLKKHLRH